MKKMTLEQFKEQFNIKLNNQQLKAVQSVQNPTLLLAVRAVERQRFLLQDWVI